VRRLYTACRGAMVRFIVEKRVCKPEQLQSFTGKLLRSCEKHLYHSCVRKSS